MPSQSPKEVLSLFYEAERRYMQAGGGAGGASFDAMSATLDPGVVLHQSPDLPFGGEYIGPKRYQVWADAMSAIFDRVDAQDPEFFEKGETVIIVCTLVTRIRMTGEELKLPMVQVVTVKNGEDHRIPAILLECAGVRHRRARGAEVIRCRMCCSINLSQEPSALATLDRFPQANGIFCGLPTPDPRYGATLGAECVIYQTASLLYERECAAMQRVDAIVCIAMGPALTRNAVSCALLMVVAVLKLSRFSLHIRLSIAQHCCSRMCTLVIAHA